MGLLASSLPSNRRLLLYFVVLAAFLPEAITGSTPPLAWLNPIQALLNLWLYGAGVLVMRELSLKWRTGWPGILLFGAAYAIIEEGLAVTTFFNPTLPMVASGPLGWYGRAFGMNWVWSVWLTIFHAMVSIAFPIFLIEWHYPALRGRRLLSDRGLSIAAVLLGLAVVAIFSLVNAASSYRVGVVEYAGGIGAVALLIYAARRGVGQGWLRLPAGAMPRPRTYAIAGYVFFALSFLVYAGGPALGGHPAITFVEGGVLLFAALLLVRRTVVAPGRERSLFAFAAGCIGFFATWAVILGFTGDPRFVGMPFVGLGFLVYLVWLYRVKGPQPVSLSSPMPTP